MVDKHGEFGRSIDARGNEVARMRLKSTNGDVALIASL